MLDLHAEFQTFLFLFKKLAPDSFQIDLHAISFLRGLEKSSPKRGTFISDSRESLTHLITFPVSLLALLDG